MPAPGIAQHVSNRAPQSLHKPRIVILGSGWGAMSFIKGLSKKDRCTPMLTKEHQPSQAVAHSPKTCGSVKGYIDDQPKDNTCIQHPIPGDLGSDIARLSLTRCLQPQTPPNLGVTATPTVKSYAMQILQAKHVRAAVLLPETNQPGDNECLYAPA